jgi:hypothetical protein
MDRIWQWALDRYGARYSWAVCAITFALVLPIYLALSFMVVAFEKSDRYVEAAAVTVVALPLLVYVYFLPGLGRLRLGSSGPPVATSIGRAHWTPPTAGLGGRLFEQ